MAWTFGVYILANRSRNLYTGVTNNVERRIVEHREKQVPGFTSRYRIFRLVHYEVFTDVGLAIAREKEIKGWRREKKVWLIERNNPTWEDLSEKFEKFMPLEEWQRKGQEVAKSRLRAKADPSPPSPKGTEPGSG